MESITDREQAKKLLELVSAGMIGEVVALRLRLDMIYAVEVSVVVVKEREFHREQNGRQGASSNAPESFQKCVRE